MTETTSPIDPEHTMLLVIDYQPAILNRLSDQVLPRQGLASYSREWYSDTPQGMETPRLLAAHLRLRIQWMSRKPQSTEGISLQVSERLKPGQTRLIHYRSNGVVCRGFVSMR